MSTKADLQSIAETHGRPFIITDEDYRIVAANRAFLAAYGASLEQILNRTCYEVTHGNPRPCHELGEECPNQHIKKSGKPHTCLHVHTHFDNGRHVHHVRVKGFPLRFEDGERYYGEVFEELVVREERRDDNTMVGSSEAFLASLEAMRLGARSNAPVLIQGETGTGKELAAQFIHRSSSRAKGPFLTLDCTVLTETLVESELFGHVRGAFTGSVGERQGLFKLANGGSLFLDEIGELPKVLQTKLLRVLETGEFRRVGSDHSERTDVRIICATNRKLAVEVQQGRFREDLYYRLACLTVDLPALRERRDDIPALAGLMLQKCLRPGDMLLKLTDDAIGALMVHDYPGNVRELRNILMAAAAGVDGTRIGRGDIERVIGSQPLFRVVKAPASTEGSSVAREAIAAPGESMEEVERAHLRRLMASHEGNLPAVAAALGVSLRTVYRKLNRYDLR